MLNAIILEDEENNRNLLSGFLKDYCPQVRLIAAVDSVAACLAAIRENYPDLIFADIQLRGETCFDLFEKLQNIDFDIIFTTAYDTYSLKAIKLSAIDYLLKPIDAVELKLAIQKAEKKRNQLIMNKRLEVLINNTRNHHNDQKIVLSSAEGFDFVNMSHIIYLKSEGAYTYFYTKPHERYVTSKNLGEYEELLADHNFFRIHKSYIINTGEVVRYIRGDGGYVVMSNGDALDVSRRRKDEFLHMFEGV